MKKIIAIVVVAFYMAGMASPVFAETINLEVSGNGEGSTNSEQVETQQQTSVDQANQSEVDNQVGVASNTGGNNIQDNTDSDISASTGDSQTQLEVTNTDLNQNTVDISCDCPDSQIALAITDNGATSQNSIDTDLASNTQVNQANQAAITNNINITSNTGGNKISNNASSSITLATGNITETTTVDNTHINNSTAQISQALASGTPVSATIHGNGSGSTNQIAFVIDTNNQVRTSNQASISNIIYKDLSTGNNWITGNTAATIGLTTGSIFSTTIIDNSNINTNWTLISDCCSVAGPTNPSDPGDPQDPAPPTPPGDPGSTSNGGGSSSDSGSGGNGDGGSDGQVLGLSLPNTGGNFQLFLLVNLVLLTTGIILRFQPWKLLWKDLFIVVAVSY